MVFLSLIETRSSIDDVINILEYVPILNMGHWGSSRFKLFMGTILFVPSLSQVFHTIGKINGYVNFHEHVTNCRHM